MKFKIHACINLFLRSEFVDTDATDDSNISGNSSGIFSSSSNTQDESADSFPQCIDNNDTHPVIMMLYSLMNHQQQFLLSLMAPTHDFTAANREDGEGLHKENGNSAPRKQNYLRSSPPGFSKLFFGAGV